MSDIENFIGNTPLVLIDQIGTNVIYGKLEGIILRDLSKTDLP